MASLPLIKKEYYDCADGQIHYRYLLASKSDATKLPILLLHMSAASSLYYEPLMQRLAALGHDCYAPDMPGFGNSYNPVPDPTDTRFYVDIFMLLVKQLKWTKFHLVGHHSGAALGTEIASLHVSQVASLCIIGPALLTPPEQEKMGSQLIIAPETFPVADGSHLLKKWRGLSTMEGFWRKSGWGF